MLAAVNAGEIYPNLQALCSGIHGAVPLLALPGTPQVVGIAAVGVEGGQLTLDTVTLTPDGSTRKIDLSIRA